MDNAELVREMWQAWSSGVTEMKGCASRQVALDYAAS
jgi:hypothetical protein